jgi:hypothetical protein
VRSFFTQFHTNNDDDNDDNNLSISNNNMDAVRTGMRSDVAARAGWSGVDANDAFSSAAKLDFLLKFRATMTYVGCCCCCCCCCCRRRRRRRRRRCLIKRATNSNFANLVNALRKALETGVVVATKEAEASEIVRCIAQCLSICDVFATPAERRGVADDIVQLFELIVQLGVVPLLAKVCCCCYYYYYYYCCCCCCFAM